jgi:hypothetical protein
MLLVVEPEQGGGTVTPDIEQPIHGLPELFLQWGSDHEAPGLHEVQVP